MDAVHLHLLTNHIPVVGAFFGSIVLAFGLARKSPPTLAAGFTIFVLSALIGLAAYFSGEGAEEAVEHLPGVSHKIIEAHEEVALFALIAFILLGLLSIFGLIRSRTHFDKIKGLALLILMLAIGSLGIGFYTALTGGEIRHTELRSVIQPANTDSTDKGEPAE
jgi:uncharacterized membrane protein